MAATVITLDTSGVIAITNEEDPDHAQVVAALYEDRGPWIVPAGILGEAGYMLDHLPAGALDAFLEDLDQGAYTLDCGDRDFSRIRELVHRYADMPLGFADASVISCAERNGGRVLTLDRRDFDVIAREGRVTIVPGGE